jgi:hypothetical protein
MGYKEGGEKSPPEKRTGIDGKRKVVRHRSMAIKGQHLWIANGP